MKSPALSIASVAADAPVVSPRSCARSRRKERGASLIEIMVVLVILLTGIFLVIRIFPIGFGTLRAHENRTNAVRLSEQLLGQVRTDAANLPQGVLMGYQEQADSTNNGNRKIVIVTGHYPDSLKDYCGPVDLQTNPGVELEPPCTNGTTAPYFSDVNNFRLIRGEPIKIPLPTTITDTNGNAITGSVYTLRFGPVFMDPTTGNPNNAPDLNASDSAKQLAYYNSYLSVRSAPMTRVVAESGGGANTNLVGYLRSQQTYLIDYGDDSTTAMIMFPPRAPLSPARQYPFRTFVMSYSYEDNNGVESVDQVSVKVDDNANGVWIPVPTPSGGSAMDISPGSDTVSRAFVRLKTNDTWDKYDPYEYKLASSNVAPTAQANLGVLNFNPAGANYSESTVYGSRAFTAYLDYAVLDWHIIHEDREVPGSFLASAGLVPIKTTLTFIKRFGDVDTDNTVYNGLYNQPTLTNSDIQVFNLDDPTGAALTRGDYNNQAATPNADFFIDDDTRGGSYRTGTIYVNTNRLKAGTKLRVLYKAEGDWAVSLQKAYDRYTLLIDSTNGNNTRRQFVPVGSYSGFAQNGSGTGAQIRLPYTDLNKAFLVTIQYKAQDGSVKRLSPIQMVADGDSSLNPAIESTDTQTYDQHFSYINVSKYLSPSVMTEFNNATDWYPYGAIQGVSVKARVIWHDANSSANTWRVQDLDTFLTPAPQEDVK